MSVERALTRQDFVQLLERAYELEESRISESASALADVEHAAASIGRRLGSVGRALDGLDERRERRIADWLGSRSRLRRTIRSDIPLQSEAGDRLADLLRALGGMPIDVDEGIGRETEDGIQVRIRADSRGAEIAISSDHRADIVGAAMGMTALAGVAAVILVKGLSLASGPEIFGVGAAGFAGGYLSLRLYLQAADARWRRRLDEVGLAVEKLVRRAGAAAEQL